MARMPRHQGAAIGERQIQRGSRTRRLAAGCSGLSLGTIGDTPGQVFQVWPGTDDLLVADERGGLAIYPLHDFAAGVESGDVDCMGASLSVWPNPTTSTLSIRAPMTAEPVSLTILDATGRRIRSLAPGAGGNAGGSNSARSLVSRVLRWDGLDERGHEVPGGIYFVHLRGAGVEQTRRVVIAS
jgi:hypothetical protein